MSSENFSPEDSIRLIQSMIDKTRKGLSDQSHYFLLWGWGTFLALTGQFVLKALFKSPYHYHVWWISVICSIISIIMSRQDTLKKRSKSYVGEGMSYLWTGMGISFFVVSLIFIKLGWNNCYPFFITLYGLGTFVSGRFLQFRPFVWGGIFTWILAAVSVWFDMDAQILFAAAAILVSYIIPGHMLRLKYNHKGSAG